MSNVENLVLEHLRALRAGQDRIEIRLAECLDRLDRIGQRLELTDG